MSPDEFIRSNIIRKLTDSGYQGGLWNQPLMRVYLTLDEAHKPASVAQCLMIAITQLRHGQINMVTNNQHQVSEERNQQVNRFQCFKKNASAVATIEAEQIELSIDREFTSRQRGNYT